MGLNLFSSRDCFGDSDANAFFNCVEVFVSREIEKNFGKFVVRRDDCIESNVGLEFLYLERINNGFVNFFHSVTS